MLLGERFKAQNVLHVPPFKGKSISEDGQTEVELMDRVYQFFQRQLVTDARTVAPEFRPNHRVFTDTVRVEMVVPSRGATIYYTLDGSEPTKVSRLYEGPFELKDTTTVKAFSVRGRSRPSGVATAFFFKGSEPPQITGPDRLPKGKVGQPYTVRFTAAPERPPVWNLAVALSPHAFPGWDAQKLNAEGKKNGFASLLGLQMEKTKGILSGTPTTAGNYVLLLQASWEIGQLADAQTYVLEIEQ